jgi:hypothetical protein
MSPNKHWRLLRCARVKLADEHDLTGKTLSKTSKVFRSAQAFV